MTTEVRAGLLGRDLKVVDVFGRPMPISAEYQDVELSDKDIARIDRLSGWFPGTILNIGLAGSGKTTLMGWIAYWFEHYFDIHTVADFYIRKPWHGGDEKLYNNSKRYDDSEFLDEQEKILDAINKSKTKTDKGKDRLRKRIEDDSESVWVGQGINLHRKVILWDDVHKKFEKRRWMDPMSILYSHVLKEYRHYYSLIIMATTDVSDLDNRATKGLTHEITSVYDKRTRISTYKIWNRDPVDPHWEKVLYLPIPDWSPLIYSFQPVAPRRRMIGRDKEG